MPAGVLLLEVEGMKCGGCVRAVEQRLRQQPGVQEASVNLLTHTAWVAVEGEGDAALPQLLESLAGLGFTARRRPGDELPAGRRERLRQQHWWIRWRQLVVALLLLLVSGLGHLADAGGLPARQPWLLLARPGFHALVASLALLGPGLPILRSGWRTALAGRPSMDTLVGLGVCSAYASSLVGWLLPASGWPCYFHEPVMLLGFVLAGRFLEERARWRTGSALEELVALQPEQALLLSADGQARPVRVGGLRPGDRLRILPGDRLPVDGTVRDGRASLDLSSLTGESQPLAVEPGAELPAGALNLDGSLELEVTRRGADSAIARIVQLVERAQERKAPIQGLADRLAGRFTLVVLVLAAATLLFWWLWGGVHWPWLLAAAPVHPGGHAGHALAGAAPGTPFSLGLQQAIAVLVVACPCALGLATPAAISVGLGQAARAGLLFRGGDAIETAARLDTLLFDKTGTLTLGRPLLSRIEVLDAAALQSLGPALAAVLPAGEALSRSVAVAASVPPPPAAGSGGGRAGLTEASTATLAVAALPRPAAGVEPPPPSLCSPAECNAGTDPGREDPQQALLLRLAAALEQHSRHPLAHALLVAAQERGLALPPLQELHAWLGEGVEGRLGAAGPLLRVGRLDWLVLRGVDPAAARIASGRQAELEAGGATLLALAADSALLGLLAVQDPPRPDAAETLRSLRSCGLGLGLLSGDREAPVRRLGGLVGLEPQELAWELRPEQKLQRIVAARAAGMVAMVGDGINDAPALAAADLGIAVSTGTQVAQESAGLVVMGERLEPLLQGLELARRTMAKVRQNLAWAFGYNLIALPLAAGVLLPAYGLGLTPPLAALLMACSSLTVVGNALLLQDPSRAPGGARS
ncbi:MAG: cation-translocating P-type ATPase [Synechococcaceae cyanobacterium]|nr:cation-translocating P-type ATPase [Synechococcaceae cyanobacterium]